MCPPWHTSGRAQAAVRRVSVRPGGGVGRRGGGRPRFRRRETGVVHCEGDGGGRAQDGRRGGGSTLLGARSRALAAAAGAADGGGRSGGGGCLGGGGLAAGRLDDRGDDL